MRMRRRAISRCSSISGHRGAAPSADGAGLRRGRGTTRTRDAARQARCRGRTGDRRALRDPFDPHDHPVLEGPRGRTTIGGDAGVGHRRLGAAGVRGLMPRSDDIIPALNRFVSGEDISLPAANRLEGLLDEAYPNDEVIQDRVLNLAIYRPGGGEFLLDTREMQKRLERLLAYLGRPG